MAIICLLIVSAVALDACGSSSDAVEAASEHRDDAYGAYLLSEVEVDRARFRAAEAAAGIRDRRRGERAELASALHNQHLCFEGNAFESCPQLEQIEEITKEMARSVKRR